MRTTRETITVRTIPAQRDGIHQLAFYRDLESCIDPDRPKVVLDCTLLTELDQDSIYLLLCCLEEAMRRNGDVRLAALQPKARPVLKSTGLDQVFQVFESIEAAVSSFRGHRLAVEPVVMADLAEGQVQTSAA